MTSHVHVKGAVLITPSEPTPNHTLQLSALDSQLFVRFTFEYLLVYKPQNGLDRAATIEKVKRALARALVPYYPLAGRVRTRADGLGLEVVCRSQGALFIDAVSNCNVGEFKGAPKCMDQWRQFLSVHVVDVLKGGPPVVVQLTWLSDGGATLAVGFNHCLCDGTGSGEFLNSFAQLATGKVGLNENSTRSPHLLGPRSTHCNSLTHPEFTSVRDLCGFTHRYLQRLTPTSITFDGSQLNKLKRSTKYNCTSFEVLSAHVWRSWARALNLPCNQIVKLVFSVDIRKRVKPSLPSGYYGNAFVLACAQTRVGDLIEKGLGHATHLVARAKERVGDEYVREVVDLVSLTRASVDSVGALIMTQWSRLGLENVDFGMGRPVEVGSVCSDKYCILLPVYNSIDAVKANLAVPSSVVEHYLYCMMNI